MGKDEDRDSMRASLARIDARRFGVGLGLLVVALIALLVRC